MIEWKGTGISCDFEIAEGMKGLTVVDNFKTVGNNETSPVHNPA